MEASRLPASPDLRNSGGSFYHRDAIIAPLCSSPLNSALWLFSYVAGLGCEGFQNKCNTGIFLFILTKLKHRGSSIWVPDWETSSQKYSFLSPHTSSHLQHFWVHRHLPQPALGHVITFTGWVSVTAVILLKSHWIRLYRLYENQVCAYGCLSQE